jgi:hypothetical protein
MSARGYNSSDPRLNNPLEELMFGAYDDHDLDEIPGATHWPEVLAVEGAAKWEELRAWVEQLQERFSHLDHHVVPRCWWRHNEHVEALSALRDHERSSFAATAPATAPVDWFRALRDVTSLLRSWTGDLSCGATHQDSQTRASPPAVTEWERFVQADVERRREQEIDDSRLVSSDKAFPARGLGTDLNSGRSL